MKACELKAILEEVGDDRDIYVGSCERDSYGDIVEVVYTKTYREIKAEERVEILY